MRTIKRLTATMLAALAAPIIAASTASAAPVPSAWTGYFDVGGGGDFGREWGSYFPTYTWTESDIHGAARVATHLTADVTAQFDLWEDYYNINYSDGGRLSGSTAGLGAHLTWHPSTDSLLGVLASFGTSLNDGHYINGGVEGAHWIGKVRLYGQAGYTGAVSGPDGDNHLTDAYAAGMVSFYYTPNLAFSGNLRFDHEASTGYTTAGYTWSVRLDYKPTGQPFNLFLAFWRDRWDSPSTTGNDIASGADNLILAGICVPLGKTTMAALDRDVGLSDMNELFGSLLP